MTAGFATALVPAGLLPDWPGTISLDIDPADLCTMTDTELDDHAKLAKEAADALLAPQELRTGLASVLRMIRAELDYRGPAVTPIRAPFPEPRTYEHHCASSCRECGGQGACQFSVSVPID